MRKKIDDAEIVDLDRAAGAVKSQSVRAKSRRARRQCEFCFTNRSSIRERENRGCEERALQALRLAHPQEYDELLQREREAAEAVTEQAWVLHLEKKCSRARRIARGTATDSLARIDA